MLDDAIERKSDRQLSTMPPRPATIHIEPDETNVTKLRHMKSEMNISQTAADDADPAQLRPQTLNRYKSRQRVVNRQVATSVSVIDGRSQQQQQQQQGINRSTSVSKPEGYVPRPDANAHITYYAHTSSKAVDSGLSNNTGTGSVVRRPKSVPPNRAQRLTCESYAGGGEPDHRRDEMTSQYAPGNVRHLVQSFQSAFRPPSNSATRDRVVASDSSPAAAVAAAATTNGLNELSWQDQVDALLGELSHDQPTHHRKSLPSGTSSRGQRPRTAHQQDTGAAALYRSDDNVNVCVVRPAAKGKALPVTPVRQSHGRTNEQTDTPNKVKYEFACL